MLPVYNRSLARQMIDTIDQYNAEYFLCSHETICTREEMEAYFKQLRMGDIVTESCNNLDEAIIKFKKIYNAEPSDEDIFFIKSFGAGEDWGREADLRPEIF